MFFLIIHNCTCINQMNFIKCKRTWINPDVKAKQFFNPLKMLLQKSPRNQSDLDPQIADRYFREIVSFEKESN